ncbi:MAG: hypothetical protein ACREP9_11705, partial [Candidatus Dormibacteraceae bacterium]
ILDDADLLEMPPVRLIGFQPEQVGDGPRDVTAYFYDLRNDEPNVKRQAMIPPAVEMFCAGRHGITLDFEEQDGEIAAKLASDDNPAVDAWGLDIHRKAIRSFVDALTLEDAAHLSREASSSDVRVLLMELIEDFWVTPTVAEAQIWGEYPFDSDPRGSAIRRLAGPVTFEQAEGWKESGVLGEHYLWWQACARLSSGEAAQLLRETAEVLRDPVMRSMLPPLTSPP